MKKEGKAAPKHVTRRDLFSELTEGMAALAEARQGKRTLRTHAIEYKATPRITPKELVRLRESLSLSRALFAVYLRTNVRTLENWEQGRAKPNAASGPADQSRQAISGHDRAARRDLMEDGHRGSNR